MYFKWHFPWTSVFFSLAVGSLLIFQPAVSSCGSSTKGVHNPQCLGVVNKLSNIWCTTTLTLTLAPKEHFQWILADFIAVMTIQCASAVCNLKLIVQCQ
jgi:hypothetical protein